LNPGEARKVLFEVKDNDYFLSNNGVLAKSPGLWLDLAAFQPGLANGKVVNESALIVVNNKNDLRPRLQAGDYSLSAIVVLSSGEVSYPNEIRFTIPPAPIKLSFEFLPYSVLLGETFEVEILVQNEAGVPYEGNIRYFRMTHFK